MSEFIYCVTCCLTDTQFHFIVKEYPFVEGPKIYSVNGGKRKIKKTNILKPDTMLVPRAAIYSFFTYCFKDDIGLAKDVLKDTIMALHQKNVADLQALSDQMAKGTTEEPIRPWSGM